MANIVLKVLADAKDALKKFREVRKTVEQTTDTLNKSGKSVDGFFDKMSKGAGSSVKEMAKMSAAMIGISSAAAALSKAISYNIETAKGFEQSVSQLRSLTGLYGKDLNYLKQKALELGSTTTQTASQVIEAMKLIGSQKPELLKDKKALAEITSQAITLAEAASIDVPAAATALTGALNQMGAGANEAKDYINIMAAASQQGAGDINYINAAIVKSGATAKMAKVPFNELTAAIEAVATGGYDASTAGTSLRNIFLRLEKQANSNFKPSVVGLSTALDNLSAANLNANKKAALFGAQNIAVANTLLEERKAFNELKEGITGTNTAYDQARINTDNFAGSIASLGSAWEGLNLKMNESNGILRKVIDGITDFIQRFGEFAFGSDALDTNPLEYYTSALEDAIEKTKELSESTDTGERWGEASKALSDEYGLRKKILDQMYEAGEIDEEQYARYGKALQQAWRSIDSAMDSRWDEFKYKEKPTTVVTDPEADLLTDEQKKQAKKDAQALKDLLQQNGIEEARMRRDMQLKTAQAEIDAMEEGEAKYRKQIELDFSKRLEEITREEEDLKAKKELSARSVWEARNAKEIREEGLTWSNSGAQAKFFKNGGDQLSDEEKAYFAARRKAAVEADIKAHAERQRIEESAMNDFLEKYGTMQERRLAISNEYEAKIKKAQTEGEKKSLKEEMTRKLNDLDLEELKLNINWEMVFGDLSQYTKKQLSSLKGQLKEYKKSEAYTQATVENKKVIDEALNDITNQIVDKSGIFGGLGEALNELSEAQRELAEATKELQNATNDTERQTAKVKVNKAQQRTENAEAKVNGAAKTAGEKIGALANTITQLGSASEMTLSDLGNLVIQVADTFGKIGEKAGGWIGAIFAICDMVAQQGLKGLAQNVGKLLGQVAGGIFGFDIDSNTHFYEKQKEVHDKYIDLLDDVISRQEELLKRETGLDAYDTYKKTADYYNSIIKTRQSDVYNFLNAGASKGVLGIGSSASNGRKLWEDLFTDDAVLSAMGGSYGASTKRFLEIFGLSSLSGADGRLTNTLGSATVEQIKQLKEIPEIWTKLPDEVIAYYNEILKADEAAQQLKDTLSETVTGSSFDSLESSFASTLENMEASAEDWSKDIEGIFNKAIVNSLMKDKYSKLLREWYGSAEDGTGFAGLFAKGIDNVSEAEIEKYRQSYKDIAANAQSEANALRGIFGMSGSAAQEATRNAITGISYDQANQLIGRITAMQIALENSNGNISGMLEQLRSMGLSDVTNGKTLTEVRDLMIMSNSYLENISKYNKRMYDEWTSQIQKIVDNTKRM